MSILLFFCTSLAKSTSPQRILISVYNFSQLLQHKTRLNLNTEIEKTRREKLKNKNGFRGTRKAGNSRTFANFCHISWKTPRLACGLTLHLTPSPLLLKTPTSLKMKFSTSVMTNKLAIKIKSYGPYIYGQYLLGVFISFM